MLYACSEAPPQCKKIEREVTKMKQVPTGYEEREVTETVIEWDCGNKPTDKVEAEND